MKTKILTLTALLLGVSPLMRAMEAAPLVQKQSQEQTAQSGNKRLDTLKLQAAERLIKSLTSIEDCQKAQETWAPVLLDLVKEKLLLDNLPFLASLFQSVSCRALSGHENQIMAAEFGNSNLQVATGSKDRTIRLWNLSQNPITNTILATHESDIEHMAISKDLTKALTTDDMNQLLLWDLTKNPATSINLGNSVSFTALGFNSDAKFAFVNDLLSGVQFWSLENGPRRMCRINQALDLISAVDISSNGKYALTGSLTGKVGLWNIENNPATCVVSATDGPYEIRSVALSSCAKYALSGFKGGKVRYWDLTQTPPTCTVLLEHGGGIPCPTVSFSPCERFALSGGKQTARMCDLQKQPITHAILTEARKVVEKATFSADGKYFLTFGNFPGENNVYVRDLYGQATTLNLMQLHMLITASKNQERVDKLVVNCKIIENFDNDQSEINKTHKASLCRYDTELALVAAFTPEQRKAITDYNWGRHFSQR